MIKSALHKKGDINTTIELNNARKDANYITK